MMGHQGVKARQLVVMAGSAADFLSLELGMDGGGGMEVAGGGIRHRLGTRSLALPSLRDVVSRRGRCSEPTTETYEVRDR